MQHIISTLSKKFSKASAEAKTIDELRDLHSGFLQKIVGRCLLAPQSLPLKDALTAIFDLSIRFFRITQKLSSAY